MRAAAERRKLARAARNTAAPAKPPPHRPFAQLPHGKEACDKAQLSLF